MILAAAAVAVAAESYALKRRTGRWAGRVAVECRRGHRFDTTWIPGVSITSLRLGVWRLQRCPVGHHWSLVKPVAVGEPR